MSLALYRAKQFGVKLEATPGTAETIAASDFGLELTELTTGTGVEAIEAQAFRGSISSTPTRIGKKTASANVGGELKNSNVLNTVPKIDTILQMSRMVRSVVRGVAVSAVTGTIVRGITVVSGVTSSAKGLAVKLEGGKLYLSNITGTFTPGETISGGTFSATLGAIDAAGSGFAYTPSTTTASEKTGTVKIVDGGFLKPLFGATASLALELNTDSYPKFTSTIQGVLDPDWGTAGAEVTGVTYESHLPPIVNNATLLINGTVAPIASAVTIDLGNTQTMIKDLNSDNWLKYSVVTERKCVGTLSVLSIDPGVYSAYQALFAGQTASLEFVIGAGAGKAIEVIMPAIQYTGVTDSNENGFLANQLAFTGTGEDNELLLWFR